MHGSADRIRDAVGNGQARITDTAQADRRPAYTTVQWARHSYLELGVMPTAVPCARGHASLVVGEWGLAAMANTVELLVSELVTNGLRASAGLTWSQYHGRWTPGVPPIRLGLWTDYQRVLIQVWDGNDQMPQRRQPDGEAAGGRGLLLVEVLSEGWGAYVPEGTTGKVVWAVVG
jgi:hypothetical protein